MLGPEFDLTDAERAELEERPIQHAYQHFSEPQLKTRTDIAKKVYEWMFEHDEAVVKWKTHFEDYPLWAFYRLKHYASPKRVFAYKVLEKSVYLVGSTCGFTKSRFCDIFKPSQLERVHQWSHEEQIVIASNKKHGGVFADPLGFVLLVEQCQNANSKEKHTR